uniref:NADH-ubiquinone oxidoreductase chain 3 n=1 Tax=Ixodes columnae TaxID=1338503 RepID=A0A977XW50_9ACAR|nr:NADH dehydrogenase subunit 3 [Ixodes kuntzi]YP_010534096.1 NADH dehydrogenase subunit 3 [Ixodes columnae]UNO53643.1 NADH dehydrogenase subunit 3 [Ixodes kuntzi]UXX50308.1 NADH dehydrogenase subunit 3 [Ixodes columnae]
MKISFIILIPLIIMFISNYMSMKSLTDKEKLSPFECGFDPFSMSRMPFSLKFFLISIVFLIFDIEIVIMIPFPLIFQNKNIFIMINFTIINMMILWGLIYEWKKGLLEWMK